MGHPKTPVSKRFWAKVAKNGSKNKISADVKNVIK